MMNNYYDPYLLVSWVCCGPPFTNSTSESASVAYDYSAANIIISYCHSFLFACKYHVYHTRSF